jgi:hypothetical protein
VSLEPLHKGVKVLLVLIQITHLRQYLEVDLEQKAGMGLLVLKAVVLLLAVVVEVAAVVALQTKQVVQVDYLALQAQLFMWVAVVLAALLV